MAAGMVASATLLARKKCKQRRPSVQVVTKRASLRFVLNRCEKFSLVDDGRVPFLLVTKEAGQGRLVVVLDRLTGHAFRYEEVLNEAGKPVHLSSSQHFGPAAPGRIARCALLLGLPRTGFPVELHRTGDLRREIVKRRRSTFFVDLLGHESKRTQVQSHRTPKT